MVGHRFKATLCLALVAVSLAQRPSLAALTPGRSWTDLVSSNGYTGVVVDLARGEIHHFREHLFATEEPRWTTAGGELWQESTPGNGCWQPQVVFSRDLLYDAYFGLDVANTAAWLPTVAVDMEASAYEGYAGRTARNGGTGIIRMVQDVDNVSVRATTRVFAPWSLTRAGFVMALQVTNTSTSSIGPFHLYGLVNAHLGAGRPGPEHEIGSLSETITMVDDHTILEQGFAGALVVVALGGPERITHSPAAFYSAVQQGLGDLPLPGTTGNTIDDAVSGYQWDIAGLPPGGSAWVGLVIAHHPDAGSGMALRESINTWIGGRSPQQLLSDEQTQWADFQARVALPPGLDASEEDLYRHSAALLRMAQVREDRYWLRHQVDIAVPRITGIDGSVSTVQSPGIEHPHQGQGALLASLPPGAWSYAWVRDGAYAVVGLVDAGLYAEARDAIEFFMNAHADRYRTYSELTEVPLLPYALSLTRYHGFGIEQSDTTCNGDLNFEWDGFGLFLWALRHYVEESGDTTLLDAIWSDVVQGVAEVIAGLVEDDTGLIWPDSSIWEVHWLGKEKHFAYTSIAAVRGLCDASALALTRGDEPLAREYSLLARAIRKAIFERLSAPGGALAANTEELQAGSGYWDAAVIEAVAMGLFDPQGPTAEATLQALRAHLTVPSGMGLSRNDDDSDTHGLTPYGSEYDRMEWIFLDYRASIAALHMGESTYSRALQDWVTGQSLANYLLIAENYDPATGVYRNNAPMIGFGSASFITAMRQRSGNWQVDPACGVYFEQDNFDWPPAAVGDEPVEEPPDEAAPDAGADLAQDLQSDGDQPDRPVEPDTAADPADDPGSEPSPPVVEDDGCGCGQVSFPENRSNPLLPAIAVLLGAVVIMARRLRRREVPSPPALSRALARARGTE